MTAIGLHIEAIDDAAQFDAAARKALAARKPVVAVKAGRSEHGAALTLSHTASLAGADAAMDALLRRFGVARVASLPVLLETLKLLHTVGPLPGPRPGHAQLLGRRGGADRRCRRRAPGPLPAVHAAQAAPVRATLGELVTVANPLDYHTFIWGQPERLRATFTAVMACGFDLACLVLDFPRTDSCSDADWQVSLAAWQAARDATRRPGRRPRHPARMPARGRGRALIARRHRAAARHRRGARRRRGRGRHRRGAGRRRRRRRCCQRPGAARRGRRRSTSGRASGSSPGLACRIPAAGWSAIRPRRPRRPRRWAFPVVVKAVGARSRTRASWAPWRWACATPQAVAAAAARMAPSGRGDPGRAHGRRTAWPS